jgi:tetratricopeptide (TPR) repeat protein
VSSDKQLTRRFGKWKFKKYIKARERKEILDSFQTNPDEPWTREDCGKITTKKLIRWEKEAATSTQSKVRSKDQNNSALQKSYSGQSSDFVELGREDNGNENAILLAQLFTKLGLEVPDDTDAYFRSAPETQYEEKSLNYEYVSFADLSKKGPAKSKGQPKYYGAVLERSASHNFLGTESTMTNMQDSPFRWGNIDVEFSTGLWIPPNPYNELYPFPSSPLNSASLTSSICAGGSSRISQHHERDGTTPFSEVDMQERLRKTSKLRQMCPASHPGLIQEMFEISRLYYLEERYSDAEYWAGQIVQIPYEDAINSTDFLYRSWHRLAYALCMQKRFEEAKATHQRHQQWIVHHNVVRSDLFELTLELSAYIAYYLEDDPATESLYRQVAQMKLSTYGPRHQDTMASLRSVAESMEYQDRYSESEELLRILVQLGSTSSKPIDSTAIEVTCSLATVLAKQGLFEDAEKLWLHSMQEAEKTLGKEDPLTLHAEMGLAQALRSQGRWSESEIILRENVKKFLGVRGDKSTRTANSISELAGVLVQLGKLKEAMIWWEKSLTCYTHSLGYLYPETIQSCEMLGMCYERQGQNLDALQLYQKAMEEARGVMSPTHHHFIMIRSWILALQEEEQDSGMQSGAETESSTIESESTLDGVSDTRGDWKRKLEE